jgi:predicted nucleic acid-binding protein
MIAVSDTGPIIGLAKANRLALLKNLFEKVLIPPMVRKELFAKTGDEAEWIDSALTDFIQVFEIRPIDETAKLILEGLGEGERQAIGIAASMGNDAILLIDDLAGRQAAEKLNIKITGLVGVLLLAKERGLIKSVSDIIEEIRSKGYWLSNSIVDIAKQVAGE